MASFKVMSREELQARLQGTSPPVVLDATQLASYEEAHVPGAQHITLDRVAELAPKLIPDKQSEVVVYCGKLTWTVSPKVADQLVQLGYTQVYDYEAGKADWIEAGLPTEP